MSKLLSIILPISFFALLALIIVEAYLLFFSKPNSQTSQNTQKTIISPIQEAPKTSTYQGIVIEISTEGGTIAKWNYRYDISLIIKDKNGNEIPISAKKEIFDAAKIFERRENQNKPIEFSDIKVGDSIIIEGVVSDPKDLEKKDLDITITVVR